MTHSAPASRPEESSLAALVAARPFLSLHAVDGLLLEEVPLARIADVLGTPTWVLSAGTITARLAEFTSALAGLARVHYAVKANDHLAVLRLMAAQGAGADIVSEGELRRARAAGIPASRIVFSGVGKSPREIRLAITEGILQLNVESGEELEMVSAIASALGRQVEVALRVNPDVDAGTHTKITTGTAATKFGIPFAEAATLYRHAATLPGVAPVGLAMHIGSQILTAAPYRAAFARMAALVAELRAIGCAVRRMDCGGGLGIGYRHESDASPAVLAGAIRAAFGTLDLELMVEPGRWLVGPAGLLLTEVLLVKSRRFVIVDAAMNDLLRPAIYDAWHGVVPLAAAAYSAPLATLDVVGPVCESSDTFARGRHLPLPAAGDRLAILDTGAYGSVMSSTYNARPLAPIALVQGARWETIRERGRHAELWAGECIPGFLGSAP